MSEKSHVRFTEGTVVKSGPPALMRIEVEKTRRARLIGKDSGLFRVPEVLDYDDIRGVAVYERIVGIRPLRRAVSWGRDYQALAERIGTSLAAVHRDLTLPKEMIIPLPAEFAAVGHDVFLHGDPSVENIFLDRDSATLVFLDWQMTGVHGGQATYGCRYFDVLWFVNNLLWTPTLRHLVGDPVRPVARRFLASYHRAANIPYEAEGLSGYAERFFTAKLPLRGTSSRRERLFVPRGRALTRRFIRDLERGCFHG